MLWVENGVLHSHKEMKNFNNFYDRYLKIRTKNQESRIVLHFRISTHGKVNKTNCHPFFVNDKLGFVHNGIINGVPYSTEYSDTYMFNKAILQKMPSNFIKYEGTLLLIEEFISYSKLVFLDNKNNYTIIGEDKGVWDNGNWFSNTTYKDYDYYDFGGKKVYKKKTTDVFDDEAPERVGNYGQVWGGNNKYLPKSWYSDKPTTIGGATYSNGITKSYSDNHNDFYDDVNEDLDNRKIEFEEPCECCNEMSDVLNFSTVYKMYTCKKCWDEFISEYEGEWDFVPTN